MTRRVYLYETISDYFVAYSLACHSQATLIVPDTLWYLKNGLYNIPIRLTLAIPVTPHSSHPTIILFTDPTAIIDQNCLNSHIYQ